MAYEQNSSSYEYTVVLVQEALNQRNFQLYKQLVDIFYQHNANYSPYFNKSKVAKLNEFIELYSHEFYQYGFDFHLEGEGRYGIYSSGILIAYFDIVKGFEIFIDEKINDLSTFNQRKEKIKTELYRLKTQYTDFSTLMMNPELVYQTDLDYLLINNPFKIDKKKDFVKLLKKNDLLVENYQKHLSDMIHLQQKLLESFESRFKTLHDFSYAFKDLEHRRELFFDMIIQYSFENNGQIILSNEEK